MTAKVRVSSSGSARKIIIQVILFCRATSFLTYWAQNICEPALRRGKREGKVESARGGGQDA